MTLLIPRWAVIMSTLLAFIGGYCLISFVLSRRPTLIHKKRKRAFFARHISHRGGAAENLENTMTAFRHAAAMGTDMFELDCHLSRDGEVIVAHDNSLERLAGVRGTISDYNYNELPSLLKKIEVTFDPGSYCSNCEDTAFIKLTDLFKAFPTMPMNIDVKVEDDELITKVSDLVSQFNRESITVWGSRMESVAKKLYKSNPSVPLFYSVHATLRLLFLYWSGLLPFVPIRESYLELPLPSIFRNPKFGNAGFGNTWKGRAMVFIVELVTMRRGLFKHLERRGISTFLWVLNSEAEFDEAFKLGVEGVMTDYPTRLRHFLDQNSTGDHKKR